MSKVVYNLSSNSKTYGGVFISSGESYTFSENECERLKSDSNLQSDLLSSPPQAAVGSASNSIQIIGTEAVSFLLGNNIIFDRDGNQLFSLRKSYRDTSRSFITPDFSDRTSWFSDVTRVDDETLSTSDNVTYSSTRVPNEGWNHHWINWKNIPNHARQDNPNLYLVVVKLNEVVINSGFNIDYVNGTVSFDSANQPSDVVKVSYAFANSSKFDLQAKPGKKLQVDYVEVQFSEGCSFEENETMFFQSIYNGPAIPPNALGIGHPGLPANVDIILRSFEYWGFRDFLNESNEALTCLPFMGMTKKAVILPWNYLTGHTLVPVGEFADLSVGEFHKLRCLLKNNTEIRDCEIATGTFYCMVRDYPEG